jgi:hypothetical protein
MAALSKVRQQLDAEELQHTADKFWPWLESVLIVWAAVGVAVAIGVAWWLWSGV